MPRVIPTTWWNTEPDQTTGWDLDREIGFLLQESLAFLLLESGWKIVLEESTYSNMESDRYDEFFYTTENEKVLNNSGIPILLHWITESNTITTWWI